MAPMDAIWLFSALVHHFVAPHPPALPPYRSASGIGYASKSLTKMVGNSAN